MTSKQQLEIIRWCVRAIELCRVKDYSHTSINGFKQIADHYGICDCGKEGRIIASSIVLIKEAMYNKDLDSAVDEWLCIASMLTYIEPNQDQTGGF